MHKEDELQLIKRFKETDNEEERNSILKKLLDKYLTHIKILVNRISKQYETQMRYSSIEKEDLEQQWVLWFVKSLKSFEPDRWFWLATYSNHFIRNEIVQFLKNKNNSVEHLYKESKDWNEEFYDVASKEEVNTNSFHLEELKSLILKEIKSKRFTNTDWKRKTVKTLIKDSDIRVLKQITNFDKQDYDSFILWCTDYISNYKLFIPWLRKNKEIIKIIKPLLLTFLNYEQ